MTLSLWVPVGYIGVLVISLSIFSSAYRKRSAKKLAAAGSLEPWHPEGHPERDVYQSLVAAQANGKEIPDHFLKAALLTRAMTDVKRIVQMRDDKAALAVLVQKGSLGDEATQRFTLAEQELEAEILDVVSEANTFREGWGQLIFPTASEMVTHMKHKEVYYDIPKERERQIALLGAQGKPVPKATITLPPLITPPGTQITVQSPAGAPQPGQQLQPGPPQGQQQQIQIPAQLAQQLGLQHGQPIPPHIHQMLMARMAAAQQQQQQQAAKNGGSQTLGPPRPPLAGTTSQPTTPSKVGSSASGTSSPAKTKQNGTAATKTATIEELAVTPTTPSAVGSEGLGEAGNDDDDEDDEEEGDDDSPNQSVSGDTTSSGIAGAANRAQRRANKKKNKKAGNKK